MERNSNDKSKNNLQRLGKQPSDTDEIINMSDVVIRGMAAFVWGKNFNDANQVHISSSDKNIFQLAQAAVDALTSIEKNIVNTTTPTSKTNTSVNSTKQILEIELTGGNNFESLKDLLIQLNNSSAKGSSALEGFNGLYKLLSILSEGDFNDNKDNIIANIKILNDILSNKSNKNSLHNIFQNMKDIIPPDFNNEVLKNIKSVTFIGDFFASLIKVAEISNKDKIRLKLNLRYIKKYILKELVDPESGIISCIIKGFNDISKEFAPAVNAFLKIFDSILSIIDISMFKLIMLKLKLQVLTNIIKEDVIGDNTHNHALLQVIKSINRISTDTLNNLKILTGIFNFIGVIFEKIPSLKDILIVHAKLLLINKFTFKQFNEYINNINYVIYKIKSIRIDNNLFKQIETIESLMVALHSVVQLSKVSMFSVIGMKSMLKASKYIKQIINEFKDIDTEDIKKAIDTTKEFTKLIAISAGILILGGIAMNKIRLSNLIMFTVGLNLFLIGLSLTFKLFTLLNKNIAKNIEIAQGFSELVAISGLILLTGGIIMKAIDPGDLILFTATLSLFIIGVCVAYRIGSKGIDNSMETADEFGKLIVKSTISLLLGALFVKLIGPGPIVLFTAILSGFIIIITSIFTLTAPLMFLASRSASALSLLVMVSTFALILGATYVSDGKRLLMTILFAALLEFFVCSLVYILSKNSNQIIMSLATAAALSLLVLICGFTLMTAGYLLAKKPEIFLGAIGFIVLMAIVIYGIIKVCEMIGRYGRRNITKGIIVLGAIGLLVLELTVVFGLLFIMTRLTIRSWKEFALTAAVIGLMAVVIGALLGVAYWLGKAAKGTIEYIALGAAVLAALIGLVALMGIALQEIGKSMKIFAEVSKMKCNFGNLIKMLSGLLGLTPYFWKLGFLMVPSFLANLAMMNIRNVLLNAAEIAQAWAELKIPIYKDGKIVDYKYLDKSDMKTASDNIKMVLSCIFDSVRSVYNRNKDIFGLTAEYLFTGENPFIRVAKTGALLSKMLKDIASSIKDWVDLKVPVYSIDKNGRAIVSGYVTLADEDFKIAAKNIQRVITCLGFAILDVYKSAPKDMFDYDFKLFGDSPFMKVTKSLKSLGNMLTSIASGIKDWADLKIPIYKPNSTEIQTYITITDNDFTKAAENVKSVVMCFADAIMELYNSNKDIFEVDWGGLGTSPFTKVSRGLKNMGYMLTSVASGLKNWAKLQIPIYKPNSTEVKSYINITHNDFQDAAENIKDVVMCFVNAIIDIYNDNKEIFETSWYESNTDFSRVVKGVSGLGSALGSIASAVKKWAKLQVPIYEGVDKDGKPKVKDYITITNSDFKNVGTNVSRVVTCLVESVAGLYDEHEEWFEDDEDSNLSKVLNHFEPLGDSLKEIASAVKNWAKLQIPVYDGVDKDGKLIVKDYITITNGDFKKVGKNISDVVTCLVTNVAGLYSQHEEWFEDDEDSNLSKVLNHIVPLGESLRNIGESVKLWAKMQIPIYEGVDKNGKPIITDYLTISDNEFVNASENIGKVVTHLVSTIAKLYDDPELKDFWDSNFVWDDTSTWFGDSPIEKVLSSIMPLGEIVKTMGQGIKEFAQFNIPIYGTGPNGEAIITDYITLNNSDIITASENIGKVMVAIAKAIGNLWNDPEAKKNKWFDRAAWVDPNSDSPFVRVITALEPMGNLVSGIGEGIKNFAEFKLPVYKMNKKGELIISDYKTLNDADFTQAATNIGKIIKAIGTAIYDTVQNNPLLFATELGANAVNQCAEAIQKTASVLTNITDVIGYYVNGEFPEYGIDKDGKLVIKGLRPLPNNYQQLLTERVTGILTAIGGAINDVYNNQDNKEIWEQYNVTGAGVEIKKDSIAFIVSNSIKVLAEALSQIIDIITKITNLDFNSIAIKIKGGLTQGFSDTMGALLSLTNVFMKGEQKTRFGITFTYNKMSHDFSNAATYIKEISNQMNVISTSIIKIFKDISKIVESYGKHKNSINKFVVTSSSDERHVAQSQIGQAIYGIEKVISEINGALIQLSIFGTNSKVSTQALTIVSNIQSSLDSIFNDIISINEKYNTTIESISNIVTNDNFKIIKTVIKDYINCINDIANILSGDDDSNQMKKFMSLTMFSMNMNNLVETAEKILELVGKLVNIVNIAKNIDNSVYTNISTGLTSLKTVLLGLDITDKISNIDNFTLRLNNLIKTINIDSTNNLNAKINVLKNGIIGIYETILSVKSNEVFDQHTKTLKNYVETLNKIQINKLSLMKSFVDAMNLLSSNMGNLDNLTDAIANKLTVVLFELVNQLMKADKSIENAHELQEQRKKLIEESVRKVQDLMSQHMIVEISQQTPTLNGDVVNPTESDGTTSNNTNFNNESDGVNLVENDVVTNKDGKITITNKNGNNEHLLTFEDFRAFMLRHYKSIK